MEIDAVFSGGGVKAYAFIGVLQSIEHHQLMIKRAAGTSAGAITAALIAAGYHVEEIKQLFYELDLKEFLDPPKLADLFPLSKWFFLYYQMGIYKGERFERWLYKKLAKKNVYTFNDLEPNQLKMVVSDLTLGRLVVIPDDLEEVYKIDPRHFQIAKAVRMSAGFPYFFMPKKLPHLQNQQNIIVDGGLLSNFPLWIFKGAPNQKAERPVLGVQLSETYEEQHPKKIKNALDMFQALFTTMMQAHDARYISKSDENHIIFVPVGKRSPIDLSITDETKTQLMEIGKERADQFLKYWPK